MAQKQNWHDRTLAYLLEHGYVEVPTRSTKYRRFKMSLPSEKGRTYLLGKGGAVRRELVDEHGANVQTISVTVLFQKFVEMWEQKYE